MLRVQTQHHQTLFVVLDRHPFFGLDKLALEVLQQIHRANPVAHKRLVRHTKKPRQRLPDGHRRDVVFRHQHRLQVFVSVPGQSRGVVQVGCRQVRLQHQTVVFVAHHMGALALVKRNRQGLRQLNQAFHRQLVKRATHAVVDQLHHPHAHQTFGVAHRCHQHLTGAKPGALVHLNQETQIGVITVQLLMVIHVGQVERAPGQRHKPRHGLRGNGQTQTAKALQAGLYPRLQRLAIGAGLVNGQPLGGKQHTNRLAHLQHDFIHISGGVNLVGDGLQILLKRQAFGNGGFCGCLGSSGFGHGVWLQRVGRTRRHGTDDIGAAYLPIQNREKISPNKSSALNSPVMAPSACCASRSSSAITSRCAACKARQSAAVSRWPAT